MTSFSFITSKQIEVECDSSSKLNVYMAGLSCTSVLFITDKGVLNAGIAEKAIASFKKADISFKIFDEVTPDPDVDLIIKAATFAKKLGVDGIVGFGGGSAMDVAKLVSVLASPNNLQSIDQMYGVDKVKGNRLPLILVPTTAGTGSEVTPVAIITTGSKEKSGVVSSILLPDIALLDANLTIGLPKAITAATGIDAIVHAIEAYTSKLKKNPMSDSFALEALKLLCANLLKVIDDGTDIEARENVLRGAMHAGQAFANAPVGAVHALAYPIGARHHISHGLSNALMLPHVLRFNSLDNERVQFHYCIIAEHIIGKKFTSVREGTNALINYLVKLIQLSGLPTRLRDIDIPESALCFLAVDAMKQERLLINNPKVLSADDAYLLYKQAY